MSSALVDVGALPASTVAVVLAQNPTPPPGQGPEFGKASPVALVVIVLLGIATVFLIRSMSKRIKRLPASFDPPVDDQPGGKQPADAEDAGSSKP